MAKSTLPFEKRKIQAKRLVALYARSQDMVHKLAKQLEELGFDPQGRQLRTFKDSGQYRELGRDREPTNGWN